MTWLLFAFSGPILWAISTYIDKYLVERFFQHSSVAVLLFFTSLIGLVSLSLYMGLSARANRIIPAKHRRDRRLRQHVHKDDVFLSSDPAIGRGVGRRTILPGAPLFGHVLGCLVLGETPSSMQIAGGTLIVGGAVLLSMHVDSGETRYKAQFVILMLAYACSPALSSVTVKLFAIHDEYWTTTF